MSIGRLCCPFSHHTSLDSSDLRRRHFDTLETTRVDLSHASSIDRDNQLSYTQRAYELTQDNTSLPAITANTTSKPTAAFL